VILRSQSIAWLCTVALLTLAACSPSEPPTPARPNFIIVFADDQGYADLGSFGATDFKTPHVDQLAREGMRFTDFYAQPVCGPSRTALLTGSYPIRVAEFGNTKRSFPYVHSQEILLPKMLQDAGYATGMVGKVDITRRRAGYRPELNPVRRGFDFFFGVIGANDSGHVSLLHRNEEMIEEQAGLDDLTQRYTAEALGFIREHKDEPFFLYIAHTMPHVVLAASKEFRGRSERGLYGDVIEEIDDSTGRIVALLRELELDQHTILVYTSDNGPWNNHTRYLDTITENAGSAGPLRAGKGTTWEGGIRVPCVMWGPGYIPAGATNGEVASTMDLLPTFIELAGAQLPADRVIDGRSIASLMLGEDGARTPHEAFYYYYENQLEAVRSGQWKLVPPRPARAESPWLESHRNIGKNFEGPGFDAVASLSLYDLAADIGEQTNVADQHPEVVQRLQALLATARADLGDRDRIGAGVRFYEEGEKWPNRAEWLRKSGE
jgi:arylsulfatase A-like enzyme